jgi:uncharacterized protein (TIGR03067 family)
MRLLFALATMLAYQSMACRFASGAENKDEEVFKGEWRLVGWEDSGKRAPEDSVKMIPGFRIKEGEMTIWGRDRMDNDTKDKAKIKIDPGKSPKQIDLTVVDGPRKGQVLVGIYTVEKGKLLICVNADGSDRTERPQQFSTRPGSGEWLLTFEPSKPK